jgi:hypothetical protein
MMIISYWAVLAVASLFLGILTGHLNLPWWQVLLVGGGFGAFYYGVFSWMLQ